MVKASTKSEVERFTDADLAELTTFAGAVAAAQEQFGELANAVDLGDGYAKLDDKAQLAGRAFLIMDYSFHQGDMGEYVTVRLITERNVRVRISDGSTGIYRTLRAQADTGKPFRPIMVPGGLTQSDYDVTDEQGNPVLDPKGNTLRGTTFYLSTEVPQV